jgi:DUF2075 family protein/SOS-response transcriptional repressor LexA
MKSSKHQVFFYDKNQSIRPSDLGPEKFSELNAIHYDLASQQRIIAGDEYIKFVDDLFDMQKVAKYKFPNYDLKVYDDIHNMVSDIKKKDAKLGLCRMVAGYAWEWKSRNNPNAHDIEIDGLKLKWNSTNKDWVNSPNAVNEIGCIHTVQGYDLNYVGVIIGPELSYDKEKNVLVINDDNYMDANGWRGISDPKELERYIINIYKTILTRGILGTYIYIVDEVLREYLKTRINEMGNTKITPVKKEKETLSPYVGATISIPILGSVACGSPFYVEENFEGTIEVPENKLLKGTKYFILRASGDSMNKAGINDGDLVLCQHKLTAHPNDLVVALTNDGVTIKEFHRDASDIILKPRSTNPDHEPIRFTEDGSVEIQGIVREVIKL